MASHLQQSCRHKVALQYSALGVRACSKNPSRSSDAATLQGSALRRCLRTPPPELRGCRRGAAGAGSQGHRPSGAEAHQGRPRIADTQSRSVSLSIQQQLQCSVHRISLANGIRWHASWGGLMSPCARLDDASPFDVLVQPKPKCTAPHAGDSNLSGRSGLRLV